MRGAYADVTVQCDVHGCLFVTERGPTGTFGADERFFVTGVFFDDHGLPVLVHFVYMFGVYK